MCLVKNNILIEKKKKNYEKKQTHTIKAYQKKYYNIKHICDSSLYCAADVFYVASCYGDNDDAAGL